MFRHVNAIFRVVTLTLLATAVLSVLRADMDYDSFSVASCCGCPQQLATLNER
jgi:hypothetical protein